MVQLTVALVCWIEWDLPFSSACGFTFSGVFFTVVPSVFYSLLFSVMKSLALMQVVSVQDHETDTAGML